MMMVYLLPINLNGGPIVSIGLLLYYPFLCHISFSLLSRAEQLDRSFG